MSQACLLSTFACFLIALLGQPFSNLTKKRLRQQEALPRHMGEDGISLDLASPDKDQTTS